MKSVAYVAAESLIHAPHHLRILHGVAYHAACLDARHRIVGEDE